jgi:hypothetical protein
MSLLDRECNLWSVVIGDFLDLKSITRLDTAVARRKDRQNLLAQFSHSLILDRIEFIVKVDAALRWALSRGLRFRALLVSVRDVTEKVLDAFLRFSGDTVRELSFCGGPKESSAQTIAYHHCTRLQLLGLSDVTVNEGIAQLLTANRATLQTLTIDNCAISAEHTLHGIPTLRNLTRLGVSGRSAGTTRWLAGKCPGLESLTVSSLAASPASANDTGLVEFVLKTPHLTTLCVKNIKLGGTELTTVLGRCSKLRSLHLSNTGAPNAPVPAVAAAPPSVPSLSSLRFEFDDWGSYAYLVTLAAACRDLRRLSFHGSEVHEAALFAFFRNNPKLTHVDLGRSTVHRVSQYEGAYDFVDDVEYWTLVGQYLKGLSDDLLAALGKCCGPSLQDLNLQACAGFSDEGLLRLARSCPNLRCLNLSAPAPSASVSVIPAATLLEIVQCCPQLQRLYLARLACVTPLVLAKLINALPGLCHLDISCCVRPALPMLREILRRNRHWRELHVGSQRSPENAAIAELLKREFPHMKIRFTENVHGGVPFVLTDGQEEH